MKTVTLAALALIAATCTANATPLPKYYLGQWEACGEPLPFGHLPNMYYPLDDSPCMNKKFVLTITPRGLSDVEYKNCRFDFVRLGKADSPATHTPRREWIPSANITAMCDGMQMLIRLSVNRGTIFMTREMMD